MFSDDDDDDLFGQRRHGGSDLGMVVGAAFGVLGGMLGSPPPSPIRHRARPAPAAAPAALAAPTAALAAPTVRRRPRSPPLPLSARPVARTLRPPLPAAAAVPEYHLNQFYVSVVVDGAARWCPMRWPHQPEAFVDAMRLMAEKKTNAAKGTSRDGRHTYAVRMIDCQPHIQLGDQRMHAVLHVTAPPHPK